MTTNASALKPVIVGVDGSDKSVAALRWAAGYAKAVGAPLEAVLSWHYPTAVGPAPVGVAPHEISNEVRDKMRAALDHVVAEAAPGVPIDEQIGYGHPAQVLVEASKDASLLVVGSHGHGAFTGMLVGSVSMYCVTHAHCPVVVVREQRQ
jgi:nucleotide-binding universal stress UspA family protein